MFLRVKLSIKIEIDSVSLAVFHKLNYVPRF